MSFLGVMRGLPYLHSSRSELVELHPQSTVSAASPKSTVLNITAQLASPKTKI